ncbi:hypothetical protein NQ314_010012 [Rhamnusium bicolor]|uniref:Uncharacterized protein n=1 Tax=Rhamnusium bicolor TaxID=1586634 RepID=A0AAV8XVW0_9CUCU|nr:hypothetical protein NQ314_010012 [Rhamnusium bicolor]
MHHRKRNTSRDRSVSKSSSCSYATSKLGRSSIHSIPISIKTDREKKEISERDQILSKWRKNYCATEKQITDKLEELATVDTEEILENEKKYLD